MDQNGSPAAWIPDGYTQTAYLAELPNMYPSVRFQFRPMLVMNQAIVNKELDMAGEDWQKRQTIAAKWIKQQVVNWDIKKPTGEDVDHNNVSEIIRLRPLLFQRIWNIVNGNDGGDLDESMADYDLHLRTERELACALTGSEPQEMDEKNC